MPPELLRQYDEYEALLRDLIYGMSPDTDMAVRMKEWNRYGTLIESILVTALFFDITLDDAKQRLDDISQRVSACPDAMAWQFLQADIVV